MNEDVFIRAIKLPSTVKGVTLPNPDGPLRQTESAISGQTQTGLILFGEKFQHA